MASYKSYLICFLCLLVCLYLSLSHTHTLSPFLSSDALDDKISLLASSKDIYHFQSPLEMEGLGWRIYYGWKATLDITLTAHRASKQITNYSDLTQSYLFFRFFRCLKKTDGTRGAYSEKFYNSEKRSWLFLDWNLPLSLFNVCRKHWKRINNYSMIWWGEIHISPIQVLQIVRLSREVKVNTV